MLLHRVLRSVLLILVVVLSGAAAAQSPDELFAQGQKAYDEGRFSEALPLFEQALSASGSPNARLYVARSLVKLGKNAQAYEQMNTALRDATTRAERESRYAETRDAAAAELALLEPKVGKLIVAVADEYVMPTVEVNGAPFTTIGTPTAVEPGQVVVKATAPDKEPFEKTLEVAAGEIETVTVTFDAAGGTAGGGDGDGGGGEDTTDGGKEFGAIRAAGIAVGILGVGGLITFAVTGSMAREKFDQLETECVSRCTNASYEEVIDEGKTLETVANVMAGVGGGLLVAGVLMVIFGGPSDDESAWRPNLEIGPSRAMLGVDARF
jgi:hypothetical protein